MKLLNVRKGQFVYYKNKLHKVYAVQKFFRQSIHLIRLDDLQQQLTTANEIDYYQPRNLDSFICGGKRYTLDKDATAKVGDYIIVMDPKPDSLDYYHLHAIEMVSSVERLGVITNQSNGIKHSEYWVMAKGLAKGATKIDLQDPALVPDDNDRTPATESIPPYIPRIGDVYQKNDIHPPAKAMIIGISGERIYFGAHLDAHINELQNDEKWSYVHNVLEP